MRIPSSSFVLATLAFSPALAAPTPTMPYDSPVPNSPRFDDWTESVRSPRIPRSPMLPAIRVAGRRRSIPHFKRQEEAAATAPDGSDTASAQGLLGGLGDTLSGILHTVGDVASGLPIIGGLGILSTDGSDPSDPGSSSPPPQKRDDADTASAQGLLGSLGDSVDGALHQVADAVNGLPVIGGLGIFSADGPSPQKRDDAEPVPAPDADATPTESLPAPSASTTADPDTVVAAHHRRSSIAHLRRQEEAAPPTATPTESTSILAPEASATPGADARPAEPVPARHRRSSIPHLRRKEEAAAPAATPTESDAAPAPEASTAPDADAPPTDPDAAAAAHHHHRHCHSQSPPANRRRQEDGASPVDGADTASAQGLLGGLGDTLSGLLHTVGDVAGGLPVIGGLGILSTDGSDPGAAPQKRDGPPMPVDQLNALRQQVTALLLQQQQAQQAAATLSAASSSLPVDPAELQQRLLALQNTAQGVAGGLNLQGLLGGLPVAGGLLSNTLSNGPLSTVGGITGGLPVVGGVLSTVGSVAGGLPVIGGVLGGGGQSPLGPVTSTVGGVVNGVTAAASGVLGGVAGDNAGIFQNVLGGGGSAASQAFASIDQRQWPDATGLYPHSLVNGAPVAPPNSPAPLSSSIVYGSFGMDGSGASPPVPPPSPASSAGSVPMDHDMASSLMGSASAMTATIPAPSSVPSVALESPLRRRRVDGDVVGEAPSQVQPDDHADGFSPSMPDADYTPPLLTPSKRSDIHGGDMHEGGPDAVPGPQDQVSGTLKAPRQLKMFRRLLRGASVSF